MTAPSRDLILASLEAAVPLRIAELLGKSPAIRGRMAAAWAANAVDEIASRGDVLQYGGGKRGEAAEVFGHLARALAAGAMVPGGVTFAGLHWCVEHPRGRVCSSIVELDCGRAGEVAGG